MTEDLPPDVERQATVLVGRILAAMIRRETEEHRPPEAGQESA